MNNYIAVLKKYAVFSGRARRTEYWMFILVSFIISIVLGIIDAVVGTGGILCNLYTLAVLVPGIAVGVRRMHDTNHSGWWLLFPIVNLIFAVTAGEPQENRFGPDPKAAA